MKVSTSIGITNFKNKFKLLEIQLLNIEKKINCPHYDIFIKIYNFNLIGLFITFAYAGPVIGAIAWNAIGSIIGIICVYAFLNRQKLKKYRVLNFITKPFHKLIIKIAKGRLNSRKNIK